MDTNQNPLQDPQENPIPQAADETPANDPVDNAQNPMPEEVSEESVDTTVSGADSAGVAVKKANFSAFKPLIYAALAIVLLIAIICIWPKGSNYVAPKGSIEIEYNADQEKTLFIVDGKLSDITIDGNYSTYRGSIDGKTVAVRTSSSDENEPVLYVFNGKKLIKVASDIGSFVLSNDGSHIAYSDKDGALFLFNVKAEKAEKITDEFYSSYYLSPNGKSIAFAKGTSDDYALYVNVNGKETKIKTGVTPLGLSDKAKLVYYYDPEKDAAYVQKKDEAVKISGDDIDGLIFNIDHTEVLCMGDNDAYISQNGKEKVKITSKGIRQIGSMDVMNNYVSNADALTLPIKTFEKILFSDSEHLYYLDGKLEKTEIADDVVRFDTPEKGGPIYYLNDDRELCRMKSYKSDAEEIADHVTNFAMTSDGKACYFIETDSDNETTLYYAKKTGEPKKIADDVSSMTLSHDDYCFFISDRSSTNYTGTLYCSRNGKDKEKVSEDVYSFSASVNATYYTQKDDEDNRSVFVAKKKAKFDKVY